MKTSRGWWRAGSFVGVSTDAPEVLSRAPYRGRTPGGRRSGERVFSDDSPGGRARNRNGSSRMVSRRHQTDAPRRVYRWRITTRGCADGARGEELPPAAPVSRVLHGYPLPGEKTSSSCIRRQCEKPLQAPGAPTINTIQPETVSGSFHETNAACQTERERNGPP